MSTHPEQGGSDGTWGTEQKAWDLTEHNSTGHHTYMVCNQEQVVCNENVVVSNPSTD